MNWKNKYNLLMDKVSGCGCKVDAKIIKQINKEMTDLYNKEYNENISEDKILKHLKNKNLI